MKSFTLSTMIGIFLMIALLTGIAGCGGGISTDMPAANVNSTSPPATNPPATSPPATRPPSTSVQLLWDAPTTNADGTPLTDLAGYKIYYGVSSGNYSVVIDSGNVTSLDISNLPAGTYYFAITAYDTSYNESTYSNEVIKAL